MACCGHTRAARRAAGGGGLREKRIDERKRRRGASPRAADESAAGNDHGRRRCTQLSRIIALLRIGGMRVVDAIDDQGNAETARAVEMIQSSDFNIFDDG